MWIVSDDNYELKVRLGISVQNCLRNYTALGASERQI